LGYIDGIHVTIYGIHGSYGYCILYTLCYYVTKNLFGNGYDILTSLAKNIQKEKIYKNIPIYNKSMVFLSNAWLQRGGTPEELGDGMTAASWKGISCRFHGDFIGFDAISWGFNRIS